MSSNKKHIEIIKKLSSLGVSKETIHFHTQYGNANEFMRIDYWKQLTEIQYQAVCHLVVESIYEDDDGDDQGRPIIRELFSYYLKEVPL